MQIPIIDFVGMQFVEEDGRLSPVALSFMSQLVLQMQQNLSNEGIIIPSLTTAKRNNLTSPTGGTVIYNTSGSPTPVLQFWNGTQWVTIDTTPPFAPAFLWNVVTAASQQMVSENGYICNRPSLIMFTLPLTSTVGDEIRITQMNPGGSFMISQGVGQFIQFGNVQTTIGPAGSIASTAVGDSLELVCVEDNLEWIVLSSIGNLIKV